jgi:hypothetical protein
MQPNQRKPAKAAKQVPGSVFFGKNRPVFVSALSANLAGFANFCFIHGIISICRKKGGSDEF